MNKSIMDDFPAPKYENGDFVFALITFPLNLKIL